LVQSLQLADYADLHRKWVNAIQLHQSLVARDLAISRRASTSTKNSIWSPAHDAERINNTALPSNASVFELPRCHSDQFIASRCRHVEASSPDAETAMGKLIALSNDNQRAWNQLAAMTMYDDTLRYSVEYEITLSFFSLTLFQVSILQSVWMSVMKTNYLFTR